MAGKEAAKGKEAFLKKASKFKKDYKEARKADAGGSFETPVMADGSYVTKWTSMNCGATKTDDPYVSFNFLVVDGKNKGDRPSIFHNLSSPEKLEYFVKDVKRLGVECDEMELGDTIEALEAAVAEKPYVKIDVKNKEYKAKAGPNKGKLVKSLNVYVSKVLEDYDPDAEDEDENEGADEEPEDDEEEAADGEEGDDEESDDDSEESEDGDEADEDDVEEDAVPEKGNAVLYKPKGSRKAIEFTVIKVNAKTETVDLKGDDGKTHKAVPFASVELVLEDDE